MSKFSLATEEDLSVDSDLESSCEEEEEDEVGPEERKQRFKKNYEAAFAAACERSSSSSNESLRRECPELYNDYRAKVMKHLEDLDGGVTMVQLDALRGDRPTLTIRELDDDEESLLGRSCVQAELEWSDGDDTLSVHPARAALIEELNEHTPSSNSADESNGNISSNCTDESSGRLSSNSTVELNRQVSSNGIEESSEPTSSNSMSSVDYEETHKRLVDNTPPMDVKINEGTSSNDIASVFEETSLDIVNIETSGQMRNNAPLIHEVTSGYVPSDVPSNCEEMLSWHLPDYALPANEETGGCLSSSLNEDADEAGAGNEEMVSHLPSSQINVERHKLTPDYPLPGNEETGGHLSSLRNTVADYRPIRMGNEEMVGLLSSSRNTAERYMPMPDYAAIGDEERAEHLSRSLCRNDANMSMPDCSRTANEVMCDRSSSLIDVDRHGSVHDYTSFNDQMGGRVHNRSSLLGLNESVYGHTPPDYTLRNETMGGHMPYRSVSSVNERLGDPRRGEVRHRPTPLLKKEEIEHRVERLVSTADYSKDARNLPPPSSRSLEDLRSPAGTPSPPTRPRPPKVSFFSFEQELSRCESALREAKTELREERKKQVVVDSFRMNLLEVDRMCSEEMNRLRQDAARLEPLNQMAAEWNRDSRQTFWYNQYNREQQRPVGGRDCFVKSYVRRLGDPETCQPGEVRLPTV